MLVKTLIFDKIFWHENLNLRNTLQIDWDGYTIGYLGRIFEARNKTKGGPFEVEFSFFT